LGFLSKYECWVSDLIMSLYHEPEKYLSIINKSKHSKKGECKEQNGKDLCPRRQ
jgi:hypothetical protein